METNVLPHSPDVAVIGAGPVGCVAALAFARKGARVAVLEGNLRSAQRLAGECLHPAGVQVLEKLGLHNLIDACHPGRGFAVFPRNDSHAILLPYPDGTSGLTCDHFQLVSGLRHAVGACSNVYLLPCAQATAIEGQWLYFEDAAGRPRSLVAGLIVGADGRSSLARRFLGLADRRRYISSMAGVLIENVELPYEGFGHVILGGPGPALACRIGPTSLRLFLDLPAGRIRRKDPAGLWEGFSSVLPGGWRSAFRLALDKRPVLWAANQWRGRVHYGRPGLALVGDAVGHYHPLTAVGLTLGFLDAECLARSRTFADYRRERSARSAVAELLAHSLYNVFTQDDPGTEALRQAVFRTWRSCAAECRRTIRLLSGEETDLFHFNRAFLRVLLQAVQQVLHDSLRYRRLGDSARAMKYFAQWAHWLATGNTAHSPGQQVEATASEPVGAV
jgi:squalene monooxygenase